MIRGAERTRRAHWAAIFALGLGSCDVSDNPDLYRAKEGDSCRDCDGCKGELSGCVCQSCSYYATDEAARVFLQCCGQKWVATQHCPGGVSVTCQGNGGYAFRCLDGQGQVVDWKDFGSCTEPK